MPRFNMFARLRNEFWWLLGFDRLPSGKWRDSIFNRDC